MILVFKSKSPVHISKENVEPLQTRLGYCLTGRPGFDLILFVNPTTFQVVQNREISFLKDRRKNVFCQPVCLGACSFDSLVNRGEHLRRQNIFWHFDDKLRPTFESSARKANTYIFILLVSQYFGNSTTRKKTSKSWLCPAKQ